ncbi:oligoendopeptidase F [[Mycoplasma] collis]|uniref:oligoendopeptidase F n=1 Tax=[Mycoplasma] collis TaxID=2127 RepID=UPI00051B43E8|nr:oligoendopeptidase F [[Mycoplasma] collis]
MKKFNSYNQIPKKYRFDLESLLENQTIEKLINDFEKYTNFLIENKDQQFDSVDKYIEYKNKYREFGIYFNKVYNYLSNKKSVNIIDDINNKHYAIFMNKVNDFEQKMGSEINLFFKNIDKILSWKEDSKVAIYKKHIDDLIERHKYKLSDEIEKFIVNSKQGKIALDETFSILYNSETKFKDIVDSKGKKYKLNPSNYRQYLLNKDENIRKQAYKNYLNAYLEHKSSFASLLIQHLKFDSNQAKNRNFNSLVESKLFEDRISIEMLENLYSTTKKNINVYRKYFKLNTKFFKLKYKKEFKPWNTRLPLVKVQQNYEVEQAQELFLESIKPLGETYYNKVKKALTERWVDYYHVPNKRGGAYSIGSSYGLDKKFILMNFDNTYGAVSTLAHEFGHSMHSWYSDENQPYELSSYPIILAEIASIFNELMLLDHISKQSDNDYLKFDLIKKSIDDFYNTVIKQTFWSNYEFEVYKALDQNLPINSYQALEEIYVKVYKEYASDPKKVKIGNLENVLGVTVPHFYYDFYVYKYAFGYIVANIFFKKYKENGKGELANYINKFLSAGGSKWPLEILKDAGIDLEKKSVFQLAFDLFAEKIKEFEILGNKIFKIKK